MLGEEGLTRAIALRMRLECLLCGRLWDTGVRRWCRGWGGDVKELARI